MWLAEFTPQLNGRVEVNDAYHGGERSVGKAGYGSKEMVPLLAAVRAIADGRPHSAYLSALPFTNAALRDLLPTSTTLQLTVVSDGLGCFIVAVCLGAARERQRTGGAKASMLEEKLPAVNTLVGNAKTALTGPYHAITFVKYEYL